MENVNVRAEDLKKLIKDIAQIKEMLIEIRKENEEIELTDWAKEELAEARKRPRSEKVSHEEVKRRMLER